MENNSHFQERLKELLIKSTQKLYTKLVTYYKTGKISRDEFVVKLDKFKDKVKDVENQINHLNEISEKKNKINHFNYAILEHFLFNGYNKSAEYFKKKYFTKNEQEVCDDANFYKKMKKILDEIGEGNCDEAFSFIKEYKVHLKDDYDDLDRKLQLIYFIKMAQVDRVKAIETARNKFSEDSLEIRDYLLNLLNKNDNFLLKQQNQVIIKETKDTFHRKILTLFNLEDRLMNILNYGLIAHSTPNCNYTYECPGCAYKKYSVMINRTENSIVLCEGSLEKLNESNMAYTDDKGKVYGAKYLQKEKKQLKEPRICYFV